MYGEAIMKSVLLTALLFLAAGAGGEVRLSKVDAKDPIRVVTAAHFSSGFRIETNLGEEDNFGISSGADLFLERSGKRGLNFEMSLFDRNSCQAAGRRMF
jgi:hypothetical protein